AGIIHRDLKPANVMLIERAGQGDYVKVLDFGVAKSYTPDQQTQLTHTGMLVGTVEYMAPEQIMGRTVDGRTDIYSLGVVMYRMFTGKAPFRDGGVPALIHAHLNVFAKPMTDAAPEIPGALDRVVLRCLAKQPEQRYESMEEVSRALVSAIEPADLGLVSLEYDGGGGDDPYDAGDKTEIGKSVRDSRPELAVREPAEISFDDATVKMDRPDTSKLSLPRPAPAAGASAGANAALQDDSFDRTAVMQRDSREESTAKRAIPDEVTRIESAGPRECAMCRTLNAPHARACSACGVSLAREDQEAVRARVTAPRTAHLSAPQIPPPASGAYPAPPQFAQSPAQGMPGMHGMPNMQGMPGPHSPPHGIQGGSSLQGMSWGSMPPHTHPPQPPQSAWQRFLTWTGLKAR
ncbi:MAG: hypothetical protein JWP87_1091, partial [Labilithrix sp.]|nr:hypothetical protein [Labilithrix sp.]